MKEIIDGIRRCANRATHDMESLGGLLERITKEEEAQEHSRLMASAIIGSLKTHLQYLDDWLSLGEVKAELQEGKVEFQEGKAYYWNPTTGRIDLRGIVDEPQQGE